jgi:molybdopterin-containing oxidoreductase family iron-sulfur binding subunit
MEKCTFCVQRIRGAKDVAKDEGRPIRDGEITPACVQTCPTSALVFGDLKDPKSKVSNMAKDSRRYRVLESLNTEPAITYLKKIRQDNEI